MHMNKLSFLITAFWLSFCAQVSADDADKRDLTEGLAYRAELQQSFSHGKTPLWLNANKHGLSSLKTSNGYARFRVVRPLAADSARKWGIGYGADLVGAYNYTSHVIIHQAYAEGRLWHGTLTVGSKEFPMELKNNMLSSGSQTLGINARPVPQVRIALPEYWTLPFGKKWIHFKGHLAYGRFTDDNWQKDFSAGPYKRSKGVLYHSKAGYLKIGNAQKSPLSLELGLEMASQFGGKMYIYDSMNRELYYHNPSNFKAFFNALIPAGSDDKESTYKNAEGNVLGSYTLRLNYEKDDWGVSLYADHFFDDHSAMFFIAKGGYGNGANWDTRSSTDFMAYSLKDIMLGAEIKLKRLPWLNNIVLEYLYTKYQSGPLYHDHTTLVSDQISGRDEYYNHGLYPGWQHWGQVMGNPLFRSPIYNNNHHIEIYNNRFSAVHLGFGGQPTPQLEYRVLATYQNALGTYNAPYKKPEDNYYLLADATYKFTGKLSGWSIRGGLAFDWGYTLGNNKGFQLTVAKQGLFNR